MGLALADGMHCPLEFGALPAIYRWRPSRLARYMWASPRTLMSPQWLRYPAMAFAVTVRIGQQRGRGAGIQKHHHGNLTFLFQLGGSAGSYDGYLGRLRDAFYGVALQRAHLDHIPQVLLEQGESRKPMLMPVR